MSELSDFDEFFDFVFGESRPAKHTGHHKKADPFRGFSVMAATPDSYSSLGDPRELVAIGYGTTSSHGQFIIFLEGLFDILGLPSPLAHVYCRVQPGCLSN
jgi:hypothetical protein